jgi:hypothetical protein
VETQAQKVKKLSISMVCCHMVRSEGGEDISNFNNLPVWAKGQVHFTPIGAF